MQNQEKNYFERYLRTGKKFALIGGAILAVTLLLGEATGQSRHPVVTAVMAIGALLFVFGVMNLRPNNMVKAFAMQLKTAPDDDFAKGLLDALNHGRKIGLSRRSISLVEEAIAAYAAMENAQPELTQALQKARETRIYKVTF